MSGKSGEKKLLLKWSEYTDLDNLVEKNKEKTGAEFLEINADNFQGIMNLITEVNNQEKDQTGYCKTLFCLNERDIRVDLDGRDEYSHSNPEKQLKNLFLDDLLDANLENKIDNPNIRTTFSKQIKDRIKDIDGILSNLKIEANINKSKEKNKEMEI